MYSSGSWASGVERIRLASMPAMPVAMWTCTPPFWKVRISSFIRRLCTLAAETITPLTWARWTISSARSSGPSHIDVRPKCSASEASPMSPATRTPSSGWVVNSSSRRSVSSSMPIVMTRRQ